MHQLGSLRCSPAAEQLREKGSEREGEKGKEGGGWDGEEEGEVEEVGGKELI